MTSTSFCVIACALATLCACTLRAAVVEETILLPVMATDLQGREIAQNIAVTVIRDDAREKSPFLLILHGRPGTPVQIARMDLKRYYPNARYFVERGFAVFVPLRMGYGVSGGPDVERGEGGCATVDNQVPVAASVQETLAVVEYARRQRYVDTARGLIVGQSAGGIAAIGTAARNPQGVAAAINFAGGRGGNPDKHPRQPCNPAELESMYRNFGERAKLPTLWLYSENDQYWGQELPHRWFDVFTAGGGNGKFVELPPYARDGHASFTGNPEAWIPAFEKFVGDLGF
jgi:dienelactone hydrolase